MLIEFWLIGVASARKIRDSSHDFTVIEMFDCMSLRFDQTNAANAFRPWRLDASFFRHDGVVLQLGSVYPAILVVENHIITRVLGETTHVRIPGCGDENAEFCSH